MLPVSAGEHESLRRCCATPLHSAPQCHTEELHLRGAGSPSQGSCISSAETRGTRLSRPKFSLGIASRKSPATSRASRIGRKFIGQTEEEAHMSGLSKLGVFSLGVTAGAVLGLLLAPETGEDARAYLSRAVRRGVERAAEEGSKWVERAQNAAEQISDKAQDFTGRAREVYNDAKESIS